MSLSRESSEATPETSTKKVVRPAPCIYVELYHSKNSVMQELPITKGIQTWKGLQRALASVFPTKRAPFVLLNQASHVVPSSRWSLFLLEGAFFYVISNARSASFRPTAGLPGHAASARARSPAETKASWTVCFYAAAEITAFKFDIRPTVGNAVETYCRRYKKASETLSVTLEGRPVPQDEYDTLLDDAAKLYVLYQAHDRSSTGTLIVVSGKLGTVVSSSD